MRENSGFKLDIGGRRMFIGRSSNKGGAGITDSTRRCCEARGKGSGWSLPGRPTAGEAFRTLEAEFYEELVRVTDTSTGIRL